MDTDLIKNINNVSVKELISLIDERINNKNNIFEKFNYDKFISKKEEINNKYKLSEDINIKNNFKKYIYSNDLFNYNKFNEYYINKINYLQIKKFNNLYKIDCIDDFDILDENFRKKIGKNIFILNILFDELNKINRFYNYYNKKNKYISLIETTYENISDLNIMKKVLGCIFFKNIIMKELYSEMKIVKNLFLQYQNLLNELDDRFDIKEFNNIFKFNDNNYSEDKIMSSGESYIYNLLNEIYKVNPSLIYFKYDYTLPIKFINKLRADFFCIFINKDKEVEKLIIEVNGEQHYTFNKFFNDKTLIIRDNIKKDFCKENNIEFIELKYNELKKLNNIINELLN